MDTRPLPARTALLLALSGSPCALGAQVPQPLPVPAGHASRIIYLEPSAPFDLHGFAVDRRRGELYIATKDRVVRRDANNRETLVHQLGTGDSTVLFAAPHGTDTLVYQSRQTDTLFIRNLTSGQTRSVRGLKNAYDVAATPAGQLLVVANPSWPNPGANSGIYSIDVTAGRHREVIRLTGPSGPLVFRANGDLVYATQSSTFPTPPGAIRLVRFTAAQVRSALGAATPLPLSAGQVVASGLDGAADLACDDRERLWITDPQRGGIVRTQPGSFTLAAMPFVVRSKLATLGLQFVDGGPATMDAYQPRGATMFVATSDWSTTAAVRRIDARRPSLSTSVNPVPRGRFRLSVAAAPGRGSVLVGITALPRLASRPLFVLGGVQAWFALDFLVPPLLLQGATNPGGRLDFDLVNPGGSALVVHLQALAVAGSPAAQFGTTNPLTLSIQP